MFRVLGNAVVRTWPILLGAWIALLIGTKLAAPPWGAVAQDKEFAFLPADAPSRRGEELFDKGFPDEKVGSNVVLVLYRDAADKANVERDKKFIDDWLEPGLRQIAEQEGGLASELTPSDEPENPADPGTQSPRQKSIIARIRTPNAPGTGALLVSPDDKALLVVVDLTTEFLTPRNWPILEKINGLLDQLQQQGKVPAGLNISLTGSAVIGRDHTWAELRSARDTELLTVILVVALLILIYQAPLLALIPLATVYLAVQIALNILALLAQAGYVILFQGIEIYITILAYGAGVDYCLFLTARYKEELDGGASRREAVMRAISSVGAALTASAGTVMCGIGMMVFAEFGKFHEAGLAIPLGLFIVLCATLTFSAPLLRLTGRWAFWPHVRRPANSDGKPAEPIGFWRRLIQGEGFHRFWERLGQVLLRRPGTIWLASALPMVPFVVVAGLLYNHLSYDFIGNLPASAPSVIGTKALEAHFPAGLMGPTTVLLVNPHVNFRSAQGHAFVEQLTRHLQERQDELGLVDLRSLTAPIGITAAAQHAFTGLDMPKEAIQHAVEQEALDRYVTDFGERAKIGTRLDLIFARDPFSRASVDDLEQVERIVQAALPPDLQQGSQLYFVGPTASLRDLNTVIDRDRVRIELLVLAGVFVILVLLLRTLAVSLYLIVSVLFSYYATLGIAFAVFWLLNPQGFSGIDWKVAIFLFTILIAVGEDYNIFLMTRIHEEQRQHGPVRGITEALTRTGPIISSCGLIMAGTFSSLLAGSLTEMKQLGFALACGVLLDTFVVRPILVPAFLILLHSGRFRLPKWPRGESSTKLEAQRTGVTPSPS
jgi:RND superfamily putative drug exporter